MCKIVRELEEIILIVHNIHTELNCKGEECLQNKARGNNYSSWELHYFNASMIYLMCFFC